MNRSQPLSTTEEVMDALGGTSEVAFITGRTYPAAWNWRKFKTFPTNTYVAMSAALEQRGLSAPASLWGMTEPQLSGEEAAKAAE